MNDVFPIAVTWQEYWTIAWMLFNVGMLYTMSQIFMAPHEREKDEP